MEIKLFADNKEIVSPDFDFKLDKEENILILGIKNFNIDEQEKFLKETKKITDDNFFLNSNYIAFLTNEKIYLFNLSSFSQFKLEHLLVSGYHDFMFAFIDIDDTIISNTYSVMKLNEYKLKELQSIKN